MRNEIAVVAIVFLPDIIQSLERRRRQRTCPVLRKASPMVDMTQMPRHGPFWSHSVDLRDRYDVIICGAGSSGSVIARRIAENPHLHVLLLEAGGTGAQPNVTQAALWPQNFGSTTDWQYRSEAMPQIDGRRIAMVAGKTVGGGSAINAMLWVRGHQQDWDSFADASGDRRWGYPSIMQTFATTECWLGTPAAGRGSAGAAIVSQSAHPHPVALAMLRGAASVGIETFSSANGEMMESRSGCAITDVTLTEGLRRSVFDSYVRPFLGRPNLTVATNILVRRIVFDGKTAVGVEIRSSGGSRMIRANERVVVSAGAIRTPQLLMLSGIGPEDELARFDIPVVQILPGVGRNLQDHASFSTIWAGSAEYPPRDNAAEAILFATGRPAAVGPDILICQAEGFFPTSLVMDGMPAAGWTMVSALAKPKSRGNIRLRSARPSDAPICELNILSHEDDWRTARAAIQLSRDICNSDAFGRLRIREVVPGPTNAAQMTGFIRAYAGTLYDYCCTAKMGTDRMSVVDGDLSVYGIERLTLADASIMPTIPTGNIMAPCVAIGELGSQSVVKALTA